MDVKKRLNELDNMIYCETTGMHYLIKNIEYKDRYLENLMLCVSNNNKGDMEDEH